MPHNRTQRGNVPANESRTCIITNLVKANPSIDGLAFDAMKEAVLGKRYRLSLVFAPRTLMKRLNHTYRGKNTATDILSFPLSSETGEVFICPDEARAEAKKFDRPHKNFLAFLFIHGLVHLKGYAHGSRMEALETKFRKKFGI